MGQDAPHLEHLAVHELLEQLSSLTDELVLIGGQALNHWAERYADTPELAAAAPFTSKDIDFYGKPEHVERCAELLGGDHVVYGPDHGTASAGVVTTQDGVAIDFVHTPLGLQPSEIQRRSIAFPSLRVMHPIHVLMSRAANVLHIPRPDAHALKQLRAGVFIVREFVRRDVLARGNVKDALKLNEEAFEVVVSDDGLRMWRVHGIDLMPAVLVDEAFGPMFLEKRYPQMLARATLLRSRTVR